MYTYRTRIGLFKITFHQGSWHIFHNNENLGSYSSPHQAVDDLSGGYTVWPSSGIDPSSLGIPDDIGEWDIS